MRHTHSQWLFSCKNKHCLQGIPTAKCKGRQGQTGTASETMLKEKESQSVLRTAFGGSHFEMGLRTTRSISVVETFLLGNCCAPQNTAPHLELIWKSCPCLHCMVDLEMKYSALKNMCHKVCLFKSFNNSNELQRYNQPK